MLTLSQIRQRELGLLRKLARFCGEHEIPYFLSNGTLLGAVKYGGFIPWDDDIDILVPREAYGRLLKLFADDREAVLLARERNRNYRYPFAKLCDNATVLVEENMENGILMGVNIDIFPLDDWADQKTAACRQARRNRRRTQLLFHIKMQQYVPDGCHLALGKLLRRAAHGLCKCIPAGAVCDAMVREAVRYRNARYLGCVVWPANGEKEILPAEVFHGTVTVTFEGEDYPAPAGYDTYLKSLYGDYTKDPPPDKQVTHHRFKAYWRKDEKK